MSSEPTQATEPTQANLVEPRKVDRLNLDEIATQILILANSDTKPVQIKGAIFTHYENITESEYDQAIELAQTQLTKHSSADMSELIKAFLLSFVTGIVAAVIWTIIAVLTGYEIGILATLIGVAVAYPIRSSMQKMGLKYQFIVALAALFSVFLGKYLTIVFSLLKYTNHNLESLQIGLYPDIVLEMIALNIGLYDVLWVILACGYAFYSIKAPKLKIDAPKQR